MSTYAAIVTWYDIPILQLGLHCSEKMSATPRTWPTCYGWAGCRRRGVAPLEIRELRELIWYRHKLVGLRTSCRDQVHAVPDGPRRPGHPFGHLRRARAGVAGSTCGCPQPYASEVASLRQLNGELSGEIVLPGAGHWRPAGRPRRRPGDPGAAGHRPVPVAVGGIGDIRRFPGPGQLCSWAGLTPRHPESDAKVSRGHVTKQGSRMLRWAVTEAVQRQPADTRPRQVKDGIIARRGTQAKNTAKVAAARELLTLVFCSMHDRYIRRADRPGQAA